MNTLLFLCTGNYYRSRFAEIFFNHYAGVRKLPWRADLCGLAIELGGGNVGPIALDTVLALAEMGIHAKDALRYPVQVTEEDFYQYRRVIALHQAEHWPMMLRRYPAWAERIEYWHVPDLGLMTSEQAFEAIRRNVNHLLDELSRRLSE